MLLSFKIVQDNTETFYISGRKSNIVISHAIECLVRLDECVYLPGTGQERSIHNFPICFILEFRYQIDMLVSQ
jgi:hypothetical protein